MSRISPVPCACGGDVQSRFTMKSPLQTTSTSAGGEPSDPSAGDAAELLTHAPVALCLVDHTLRILSANPEMERLLGAPNVTGQGLDEVAPHFTARIAAAVEQAMRSGEPGGLRVQTES